MQNSKEHVSKRTNPLKRQQPEDIWLIVNWAIKFLETVGHILTLKWLLKNSVRELRRLYHAVMSFFHFKIQRYSIFEKPHARAVSKTVGMYIMDKAIPIRVPIVCVQETTYPETFYERRMDKENLFRWMLTIKD